MTTRCLKWAWMALCIAGLAGCLTSSPPGPTVDSETHFLRVCSQSCPGDLQCICGVCSVTCDPARDCSDTHAAASCVSGDSFAPEGACTMEAKPSVCDVDCERDADCADLGDDHRCLDGHCRAKAASAPVDGCEYEGRTYEVGERFDAADGCNTCFCEEDGLVSCTAIGCISGETCEYNGLTYQVGERFDAIDGCNTCVCEASGEVGCTEEGCDVCELPFEAGPCEAAIPVYWHDPETGACEPRSYGGCDGNGNRFDILQDCANACGHTGSTGSGRSCMVEGEVYADGEGAPDPFSCNSCSCSDGALDVCTEEGCPTSCPPNSIEGSSCAQCGVAGGCDVVEIGCFEVCSSDDQCDDPRPFCDVEAGHCSRTGLCD